MTTLPRRPLLLLLGLAVAAGCAGRPLPVTSRLEVLTPEAVFAGAPPAEWREPAFVDASLAPVDVACGVSPRLREGTVYAAVRVAGRPARGAIAPLNVALVLDRSGSMHGQPFLNMVRAAEAFVGQLRDGDRLSIVVFSDGVYEPVAPVLLDPMSRGPVVAAIRTLESGGLTHLSGGLLAGLSDVWGLRDEWRVNHVVLLSDGQPNRGITDRARLTALAASAAERGVGLTTIGFGVDHDELLMQALADAGGGTYHYVESPADIPAVFQREASEMLSVAARDTVVQVELPPGAVLEDVLGQDYYVEGGRAFVRVGALPHDGERYLVLRLRPAGGAAAPSIAIVGADMARRARFAVACRPALGPGGGADRWVLELAGRAESSWGLAEAMGWADAGNEPFAIKQLAYTRGLLASMREQLGPGALAEDDRALVEAQVLYGAAVAAEAKAAADRGGLAGLVRFGLGAAIAATAPEVFHPAVRVALGASWYGRPAQFYSARTQRPFKAWSGDAGRKKKAARFDAYAKLRSAGRGGPGPRR